MKRGISDEKNMGPMFPRLHVNDKEKGGPRAPPRNKMALYEQLSIPSQRFNSGRMPLSSNNPRNSVPPVPSSQGSGQERSMFSPIRLPPSLPTQTAKPHTRHTEAINSNSPLAQLEQRKEVGDEDDFSVPIFVHSEMGECNRKKQSSTDRRKLTPLSPSYTGHSMKNHNSSEKDLNKTGSLSPSLGQEMRSLMSSTDTFLGQELRSPMSSTAPFLGQELRRQNEINLKENTSSGHILKNSFTSILNREKIDGAMKQGNVYTHQENRKHPTPNFHLVEGNSSPDNDVYAEYHEDKTRGSEQTGVADRCDDASETSMVDSISALDISPDDVVGIIGQKHFWKARRAIVNQQRVFGVQVFELHRLIKVQKLMAGSPHLLIEDSAYLAKPAMKVSPVKKLSAEYVIAPPPHVVKHKADLEKPNHRLEHSAENAIGRTSVTSVKDGSQQPSIHVPYLGNPSPAPMATNSNMGPWPFHQPSGHQWLVPIMSPSEGLIYKPYPGPGFMGPTHLAGNFPNPAYGSPPPPHHPHHHQGVGFLPMAPPVGHGYFPPYGMQVMNQGFSGSAVEQMNQFPGPGSNGQPSQLSGGGANFSTQHQNSCSMTTQKSRAISRVMKIPATKDSGVQGSTASSPSERLQGREMSQNLEGRNALPLFPTAPPVLSDGNTRPHDTEIVTRVIRVVPHNARSATESAARIFQSIQEERKQFDSL